MKNLLIMHNQQAVTSSIDVAETFVREHHDVIKSIEKLKEDVGTFSEMFFETTEPDSYGRNRKIYLMNRDGFTLLAMGFNGSKALHFKVEYISAFNQMEKEIYQPKVLSEKEQLMASMKLTLTAVEEVQEVKREVGELRSMVENQITLDYGEQRRLQIAVSTKVYQVEGDPTLRPRLFRELYREIKDRFGVASYKDVKRQELQSAIRYIEAWLPRKAS